MGSNLLGGPELLLVCLVKMYFMYINGETCHLQLGCWTLMSTENAPKKGLDIYFIYFLFIERDFTFLR